jgi:hypothetical protein
MKRDNPMFTGGRIPESDFVGVIRMLESDFAMGDGEEAVTVMTLLRMTGSMLVVKGWLIGIMDLVRLGKSSCCEAGRG